MSTVVSVGIDIGAQKTMIAKDDADIIRTDTGSIFRATLVAFNDRERFCGEEAVAHIMGESTVPMFNVLLGKTLAQVKASDEQSMVHRKVAVTADSNDRLQAELSYGNEKKKFHITALTGMYLAKLKKRIAEETTDCTTHISMALPVNHKSNPSVERAYREACTIAGFDMEKVFFADAADCLVAAYLRKISGLSASDRSHLEGKHVLLVDMGHTQTTAVVVQVQNVTTEGSDVTVKKVAVCHDEALGAYHFDMQLFDHFAATKCAHCKVQPGTKAGFRLLSGCERLRKLLSQLPEAQVTVEHLAEDTDISLALKREDLTGLCAAQLSRLRDLLNSALFNEAAGGNPPGTSLAAVEILGGGARMQVVQQVIHTVLGQSLPFGFKLDDSAVALGAALLCAQALKPAGGAEGAVVQENPIAAANAAAQAKPETVGLTEKELDAAYAAELSMQAQDFEIRQVMEQRNKLEAFILEMRSAPGKKHGQSIDRAALNAVLDEYENWLWDAYSDAAATYELYVSKFEALQSAVNGLCGAYFEAVAKDRAALEQALNEEAVRAAAEREAEGGEDDDHDNRKLKKADRMRLVVKNKEEGTELFKGGNFRPAAARYHKALSHAAKFFDLTKEDEAEVRALKLSLYLNLASCYIKMENWENVLRNCNDALAIDDKSVKALYRRAQYFEQKKDWDKATADLKQCAKLNGATEDKAVTLMQERIKKEVAKEKAKEKKSWGKIFG